MQKMKIDYVHYPMRKFWRTSLRPVGQNGIRSFRPLTCSAPSRSAPSRSAPHPFGPLPVRPLIYNASPDLSVTESAWSERYPFGPLPWYIQLYYRPTTTTLNRETHLQVAENYLSEQPAHLLLGLHCENRPE